MIGLLHHHLRRGGVTRVLLTQAALLRDAGEPVCIFSGEAPAEPLPEGIELRLFPDLNYGQGAPAATVGRIRSFLRAQTDIHLWHIHNHNLGKHPAVTAALLDLAASGAPLLLQIHDFAEDGRPALLRALADSLGDIFSRLYPCGPTVHLATLQPRDAAILRHAGAPPNCLHILPNPVPLPPPLPPPAHPPRLILYPGRCIRRKNLGEFLLWALHHRRDFHFATSLTPENPAERPAFAQWTAFARTANLPVTFGIGEQPGTSFREVMSQADLCITTSVGEGFGMCYLEPFAHGRPLCGRNLPDITAALSADGIDLSPLYSRMPVPLPLLSADFWTRAAARLATTVPDITPDQLEAAWVQADTLDFGRLDETEQLLLLKQGFSPPFPLTDTCAPAAPSRKALGSQAQEAAAALRKAHAAVLAHPGPLHFADPRLVARQFAQPEFLWLLRT